MTFSTTPVVWVAVHRPRVRGYDGHEIALPTWTAAQAEDWLGRWAMNPMLINVSVGGFQPCAALDRCGHDGNGQRIPSIESLPALAGSQSCACSPSPPKAVGLN
jgi:hypothetical protein